MMHPQSRMDSGAPNVSNALPALAAPQLADFTPSAEGFWGVVLRRARYSVAIAVSATLFYTLGWILAAPPAETSGVSLLLWTHSGGLLQALGLAGLLVVAIFAAMFLCHPDSPHAAMYCALLGMGALAIRGGTVTMIIQEGERSGLLPQMFQKLAIECIQWGLIVLLAELVTHLLYKKLFRNTRWIERMGLPLDALGLFGGRLPQIAPPTKVPTARIIDNLGALILTSAGAFLLLKIFMQSQTKGQVLFAIFASFGLAAFATRMYFVKADTWPFWLAIPLTAGVGYLLASTKTSYPGTINTEIPRALPIDYIALGVPGAILGYMSTLRMQLHQHLTEHAPKND